MADASAPGDQSAANNPARASVKPAADANPAASSPVRPSVKPAADAAPPVTDAPPRPSAATVNPPPAETAPPRASAGHGGPLAETPAARSSSAAVDPPQSTIANETEAELQRLRALPVRQYLETTVVPLLLEGLQRLVLERPNDPVGFLVSFLSEHNPRQKAVKASPAPPPSGEGVQTVPPASAMGHPTTATEVHNTSSAPESGLAATEQANVMGSTSAPTVASMERKSMAASAAVPPVERISVSATSAASVAPQSAAETAAPGPIKPSMSPSHMAAPDVPVPPAS